MVLKILLSDSVAENKLKNFTLHQLHSSTKQDLLMFLIQRGYGDILDKGRDKNVPLPESDRKNLIKRAHAYLSTKI